MEQAYKHTDVFLNHTRRKDLLGRNNHDRVRIVNEELSRLGYSTWFDEKKMSGNVQERMRERVEFTRCVLVCVRH